MTLKPLAGYILIEPLEKEAKTASGLVLPESTTDRPTRGKVLAIGEWLGDMDRPIPLASLGGAREVYPPNVAVGQTVVFLKWQGQDIKDGDKELKLIKFEHCIGVYE